MLAILMQTLNKKGRLKGNGQNNLLWRRMTMFSKLNLQKLENSWNMLMLLWMPKLLNFFRNSLFFNFKTISLFFNIKTINQEGRVLTILMLT